MDFSYNILLIFAISLLHNCLGQTSSPVRFQLKISPDPPEQYFEVGKGRVLTCMASPTEDNQMPDLHWEFGGVTLTETTSTQRRRIEQTADGALMVRFARIEDEDGGMYKCVGTLGSQTDSRTIKIGVIRDLKINSPAEQFGIFGRDGNVMCEVTGNPAPTKTWKYENGTRIENSNKRSISADMLTIRNLDDSDTGKYLCDIIVFVTGKSESFFINYMVVTPPSIDMVPFFQPNNPKVGDRVTITCHATGNPKPTYTYMRGDTPVPDDQVDENNGIMTIESLKREDEADYTCTASNKGGSDQKSNKLDVKIPPIIGNIPNISDAVQSGQARVTCMAEGDPAPTVTWQKDGLPAYNDGVRESGPELIPEGGNDRDDAEIKRVGKTMYFSSIKSQDAGLYICTAINVVGTVTAYFKLDVRYPPHFDTDFKDKVFYAWKDHTANVTCMASANEVAVIQFYELSENGRILIDTKGSFTVTSLVNYPQYHLSSRSLLIYVSGDDSDLYKDYICEATNTMGSANQTVTLTRAMPPQNPIIRVSNILPTKVTLEVDIPSFNGGQPVKGYQYIYYPSNEMNNKKQDDIFSTQQTTYVELSGLSPKTSYTILVAARNDVGLSTQSRVNFDTKDVSAPLKMNIISPQEGPEPYSYTVDWAEPDNGGSPITQYNIKLCRVTVAGTEPSQWTVASDLGPCISQTILDPSSRSYTIRNLERDSHYDIRLTALNKEGVSPEEFRIIKTSPGTAEASSSGLFVGIVIGVIVLIILVAVIITLILKKKRPELVARLTGQRRGVEDGRKHEDGKCLTEETQLINKDVTVKLESEVNAERAKEGQPQAADGTLDSQATSNAVSRDGPVDKPHEPCVSAASAKEANTSSETSAKL